MHGHFEDPLTGRRLSFCAVDIRHLKGTPYYLLGVFRIWWIVRPQYKLLQPVVYVDPRGRRFVIPAKFVFDGGSIPPAFWIICPTDHPNCLPGFCVHDWLYRGNVDISRADADQVFYHAMRANAMYWFGAFRNWLAVRIGGWFSWRKR